MKVIDYGGGSMSVDVSLLAPVPILACVENLGFLKILTKNYHACRTEMFAF